MTGPRTLEDLSDAAFVLVTLEDDVTSSPRHLARPRGLCPRCGLSPLLTRKGYLASHSYIRRRGQPLVLFSWRACLMHDDPPGVIIRCSGGGQRPSKRPVVDYPRHEEVPRDRTPALPGS